MTTWMQAIIIATLLTISFSAPFAYVAEIPKTSQGSAKPADNGDRQASGTNHVTFEELQQEFESGPEVTATCLGCHEEVGQEIQNMHMWNWKCPSDRESKHGKAGLTINNTGITALANEFSCYRCHISYRWEDPELPIESGGDEDPGLSIKAGADEDPGLSMETTENIDCLRCHEQTNGKYDEYRKEWNPFLNKIAQNVGRPTKRNCGSCHFYRSGGDGALRGDLNSKLLKADRDHDVHMDINGPGFDCVDCHITQDHAISARCYENAAVVSGSEDNQRYDCASCHNENLHQFLTKMNDHIDRVACETCHIPIISKNHYSRVWSDFSKAGKLRDGKIFKTKDENGKKIYSSRKGEWRWAKNITPEYLWFNGGFRYTLTTDKIDPSRTVMLNFTDTDHKDRLSKIYPFKVHKANQPYDKINSTLVVPKFTDKNKDSGAYWIDYDWNKAIHAGMNEVGLPYSGEYDFVKTAYLYPIHHTVAPKEKALDCADCHRRDNGRLEKLKGFYMPGRDRSTAIDDIGALCILLAFGGVLLHATIGIKEREDKGDK